MGAGAGVLSFAVVCRLRRQGDVQTHLSRTISLCSWKFLSCKLKAFFRQKSAQEPGIAESSTCDLVQICAAAGPLLLSHLEPLEAINMCRVQSSVSILRQGGPWFQNRTKPGLGNSAFRVAMDNLETHTFTDCVKLCRGHCQTRVKIVNAILQDTLTFDCSVQAVVCTPNDSGNSPVLQAIMRRSHIALKVLLDAGAPVDIGNATNSGWSNLMHAITRRDLHVINLLLARGADANHIAEPHGWTPLMVAVAHSHEVACLQLLDAGADAQMAEDIILGLYRDCRHVQTMLDMLVYVVKKHSRSCPT